MKIKIIDLLNMNENKLPNRIKVFNTIFEIVGKNYYATSGDYENMNLLEWVHDIDDLNEQVEIIEEDKKIEKLNDKERYCFSTVANGMTKRDREALDEMFEKCYKTIDELIDEVNKLIEKEKQWEL